MREALFGNPTLLEMYFASEYSEQPTHQLCCKTSWPNSDDKGDTSETLKKDEHSVSERCWVVGGMSAISKTHRPGAQWRPCQFPRNTFIGEF